MVLVPDPVVVIAPGDLVRVHVPEAGSPLRATLPVATVHVGWLIVPMTGAVGVEGWALMTTFPEETDTHPSSLVTV